MEHMYWMPLIIFLILFVWMPRRKQKLAAAAHHVRKKREDISAMEALAKQFTGKECIIYTITSSDGSLSGTIREVGGGGILLEDAQGQMQAVNLEYVIRIREYPRNKKGQKKSVVWD